MNIQETINNFPPWVPFALIVINCLLYEWVGVFELPVLHTLVVVSKIVIPLFLLFIVLPGNIHYPPAKMFIYFFALFMVWGAVSTIVSGNFQEGIYHWAKFMLRFAFCFAIFLYFIERPASYSSGIIKIIVIIATAVVLQYLVLEMLSISGLLADGISIKIPQGGLHYGPWGLLGNGTAQFSSFTSVPKFQLQGFWLEPSNAAGFLFMASFLAEFLHIRTQEKRWIILSGICCLGGIFAFANGGYFALGAALLIGQISSFIAGNRNRKLLTVLIAASIFLILFSLFGRYAVIKYVPYNRPMKALTGVRGELLNLVSPPAPAPTKAVGPASALVPEAKPLTIDATMSQRGQLIKKSIDRPWYRVLIGDGFRIPGIDVRGSGVAVSASAPFMWFYFTGIIGLAILCLRELQVLWGLVRIFPPSPDQLLIFQAWIVVVFQNIAYGAWMTPLYFLLIALVFSSFYSADGQAISGKRIKQDA